LVSAGINRFRPDDVALFRLTPTVISVLDYTKGFGHTDLVNC
jgi:hypothetical protein